MKRLHQQKGLNGCIEKFLFADKKVTVNEPLSFVLSTGEVRP